jgi:predicted HicB family RNase H-like nuclease
MYGQFVLTYDFGEYMKIEYFKNCDTDLNTRLPKKLKDDVTIKAKEEGKSLSQLTRELFIEFLTKQEIITK